MLMKRILLLILFCLISISFHDGDVISIKENIEICDTSFLYADELNDSILYLALVHYEIKHPKIVLAQAKLESGNYTSYLYRTRNNFLGLYNSKKGKYFEFSHWTKCIQGYKDMIEYRLREGEDYYAFLHRIGYAEDPDYISKVKYIEDNLEI